MSRPTAKKQLCFGEKAAEPLPGSCCALVAIMLCLCRQHPEPSFYSYFSTFFRQNYCKDFDTGLQFCKILIFSSIFVTVPYIGTVQAKFEEVEKQSVRMFKQQKKKSS